MPKQFQAQLDLNFLDTPNLESLEQVAADEKNSIIALNTLRLLMMHWSKHWTEIMTYDVIKAVMLRRDAALLKELRKAFQDGFEYIGMQLKDKAFSAEEEEQIQMYLSNCLSLLPYSDLTPYESIKIPQKTTNGWEMVEYGVKPIELTPTRGFQSFFIQDSDRAFAYGLDPISHQDATPHLIFMGTTYPAGQGFHTHIKTDSKGFTTVGHSLYESGKERIEQWLDLQQNKPHVCGVSLGGSLSLMLAIDKGDRLSRVDAQNPAGLHDASKKSPFDKWDNCVNKPKVVVQKQANDPVSIFGVWKKDWEIVQVTPPVEKKGPNYFCDHFLNYAGFSGTEFNYLNPTEENNKNKHRNFWIYSLGRGLYYYTFMLPYHYTIRPVLHHMAGHWSRIVVGVVGALAIGALIGLTIAGIVPVVALIASLVASVVAASFYIAYRYKRHQEMGLPPFATLHDPDLPRNADMDVYKNKETITLTKKEHHSYYHAMRCILKGKDYLETNNPEKKEQLSSNLDGAGDGAVTLTRSKAKVLHIRKTLRLIEKLGMENQAQLKEALNQEYLEYHQGKNPKA